MPDRLTKAGGVVLTPYSLEVLRWHQEPQWKWSRRETGGKAQKQLLEAGLLHVGEMDGKYHLTIAGRAALERETTP